MEGETKNVPEKGGGQSQMPFSKIRIFKPTAAKKGSKGLMKKHRMERTSKGKENTGGKHHLFQYQEGAKKGIYTRVVRRNRIQRELRRKFCLEKLGRKEGSRGGKTSYR